MANLQVVNPFTRKQIAELPMISEKETFERLEIAHKIFIDKKKWLPKDVRIEILTKLAAQVRLHRLELAQLAASEGGKALKDSLVEADRAVLGIEVGVDAVKHLVGSEIPMGITKSSLRKMALTIHEPRGVVLAISAFNHPLNLIVHQVIPAIAAGCPVLVRPASTTPLSCKKLVEMLYEAGLPKDYCQLILCDREVAEKLVSDERVAFLSFIGSSKVGWHLKSKLTPQAGAAMEHGGTASAIIYEDADFAAIIPGLVKAGYYHSGQVCVSLQKAYVPKSREKEFTEMFVKEVAKLKVGDPLLETTDYGPLITPADQKRVHDWVQEVKGSLVMGGELMLDTCMQPTVLLNPPREAKVTQLEIFGPVVNIYSYTDVEAVIQEHNATKFSFQTSIYTNDVNKIFHAVKNLDATTVMVNDQTAFRVDWMPFGGRKDSGFSMGGIPYAFHDFLVEKMAVFHSAEL